MISINLVDKCGTKSVKLSSNKKVVTKNDDKCHTNSSDGRAKYELGALVGALSPQAGILHTKCFSFSGTYNHFHKILRPFDVLPNLFFLQVKQCAILTYKHGIYKLPHELPNNLRVRILGN